jgi:hypothetical protein
MNLADVLNFKDFILKRKSRDNPSGIELDKRAFLMNTITDKNTKNKSDQLNRKNIENKLSSLSKDSISHGSFTMTQKELLKISLEPKIPYIKPQAKINVTYFCLNIF